MLQLVIVGIGGFLGSMGRYGVAQVLLRTVAPNAFPFGTFMVNVIGCFVIGVLAGLAEQTTLISAAMRLFLFTGVLGGFTTFSAFGLETIQLLRYDQFRIAVLYVAGSVVLGLCFVWLGILGGRWCGELLNINAG